ncbi:CRB [Mytilus edulis]|uniref:CRB n=1 Tax=Mytilus edulis TaxID=6550 RepID=A0A8S3U722_MYTED|nr:CRB [Mytilus edulis]
MFFYCCNACEPSGFCQPEQWAPWGYCNAACGGGVQKREKYICCDPQQYNSLQECLTGCSISSSWYQSNAVDHKKCGNCSRGGTFQLTHNRCICPLGYGGSCCDVKTTTTTTTTTVPTTYIATCTCTTRIATTTIIQTTSPTTKPTTSPTTEPTTTTTATTSTSPTTITTTSVTTPTTTTSHTHKPATGTTLLKTLIESTTKPISKLTMTQKGTDLSSCIGNPCQHGTCIPADHHYICLCTPGYEGQNCDKDLQIVEDRKPANYVYTQIQYMYVFPIFSCNCNREQTKVQPMKEKIKPKPMERQLRYDRW